MLGTCSHNWSVCSSILNVKNSHSQQSDVLRANRVSIVRITMSVKEILFAQQFLLFIVVNGKIMA